MSYRSVISLCSVFALVKNECETDRLPSLEKARQLPKNVRHVLRQDILKYLGSSNLGLHKIFII